MAFKIKRNDLQPYFYFFVEDLDQTDGLTFTCTMLHAKTREVVINRQAAGCELVDAATKKFVFKWQDGNTAIDPGTYHIEFEMTPALGGKFTVPVDPPAVVQVIADYDGV